MAKAEIVYMDRGFDHPDLTRRHVTSDPIGIQCLAGHLVDHGHDVNVRYQRERSVPQITKDILANKPDVVGLSCLTYNLPASQQLARTLKRSRPDMKVVFGGEHPTLSPGTTLDDYADAVVRGEGEITFDELLRTWDNGGRAEDVRGLYLQEDGNIKYTGEREPADIDSLSWPLRKSKDVRANKMYSLVSPSPDDQKGLVTLLGSRGCSFACRFCSSRDFWGGKTRFRSPKNVAEEIETVNSETGASLGVFYDLTFNANSRWVDELCVELNSRNISDKMSLYSVCRVSAPSGKRILTREMMEQMSGAGFVKIGIGIESTDDVIAGNYKGGESPWENISGAIHDAHDLGLVMRSFLILGGPDETPKTFAETKRKLGEVPLHEVRVGYLTPFPGTRMDDEFPMGERHTSDLREYDCSVPVVKNPNFTRDQLVAMESDLLKSFYGSVYRREVVEDLARRNSKLEKSVRWVLDDWRKKGLRTD